MECGKFTPGGAAWGLGNPPGKAAFPYHNHYAIEELFYIIEGSGELVYGQNPVPRHIRAGDVIICRAGGPETAHQIRNAVGTKPLLYLGVSTRAVADYVEHPMSQKFCVWIQPTQQSAQRTLRYYCGRNSSAVHFYDGEVNSEPESSSARIAAQLAEESEAAGTLTSAIGDLKQSDAIGGGTQEDEDPDSGAVKPSKSDLADPFLDYRGPPPQLVAKYSERLLADNHLLLKDNEDCNCQEGANDWQEVQIKE